MTRVYLLVSLFLLISAETLGQCANPPTVTLSSNNGSACGTTPVTVNGNIFGGIATGVTITENGGGSVSPTSSTISPFAFTYTPRSNDAGKTITITVTTTIPNGSKCTNAKATYTLTVNANPTAPRIGTITQPTCSLPTGSVVLSGLPSTGTWTITRTPGGVTSTGTGTSTTISGIPSGTYTFNVTNSVGCISTSSANVVINAMSVPASPAQTVDCTMGPGRAAVTVTSPLGAGLQYRLDGGAFQSGTSFTGVANGDHTVTVRSSSGCTTTGTSFPVSCGCVFPPTLSLSSTSGKTCGTTPITVSGNTFDGGASTVTITENGGGTVNPTSTTLSPFAFSYTPTAGDIGNTVIITVTTNNPSGSPCTAATATFTLSVNAIPSAPVIGTITQPTCALPSGSAVLTGLPSTGTWTLSRAPDGIITTGTGTTSTITGLTAGTYTFTVTNAAGCTSLASATVVISAPFSSPTTPVTGTIIQPTCIVSTGSVLLSGLPSTGNWTLTRTPGSITIPGSGTSITISDLSEGTYTFAVTNSEGCISPSSANVIITAQPATPAAPTIGNITLPTCTSSTGSVTLNGLPGTGTWTLTRYPGTVISNGNGTSTSINGLSAGTYNFTVTNTAGCVSGISLNVIIPAQPAAPSPPLIGTVTQPGNGILTGSVVLNGLPEVGDWTLILIPGNITTSGNGITKTISGLAAGTYNYTVTNTAGCTSGLSAGFTINSSIGSPLVVINNPEPVCSPSTVNLTSPQITTGSTPNLTFTYWVDAAGTIAYNTPASATAGTYYIKGTTIDGFFALKPVTVTVYQTPVADAGPDQVLDYLFAATLNAQLAHNYETGLWTLVSGSGMFLDATNPKTNVSGLSTGRNSLLWTVTNKVCPESSDTIIINVSDMVIPTLITPNMDGKNDYFIVKRGDERFKIEIIIFDRRGVQVYRNLNYDNSWNGVDSDGKLLSDDTYFYILKTDKNKSRSGYIVIRR